MTFTETQDLILKLKSISQFLCNDSLLTKEGASMGGFPTFSLGQSKSFFLCRYSVITLHMKNVEILMIGTAASGELFYN